MQIGFLLCYPLLVHMGIIFKIPGLLGLAIVSLAAGVFFKGLKAGRVSTWAVLIGIVVIAIALGLTRNSLYPLYLPPIVVPLLLSWGFTRTLMPGNVPLVTEIGENSRGPLSQEMIKYTRGVTEVWAVCLLVMALWAIILPIFGTLELWSFFTNVVNQTLVASLFVGEFIYRKIRFRDHDHPNFLEYLRIVFRAQYNKRT